MAAQKAASFAPRLALISAVLRSWSLESELGPWDPALIIWQMVLGTRERESQLRHLFDRIPLSLLFDDRCHPVPFFFLPVTATCPLVFPLHFPLPPALTRTLSLAPFCFWFIWQSFALVLPRTCSLYYGHYVKNEQKVVWQPLWLCLPSFPPYCYPTAPSFPGPPFLICYARRHLHAKWVPISLCLYEMQLIRSNLSAKWKCDLSVFGFYFSWAWLCLESLLRLLALCFFFCLPFKWKFRSLSFSKIYASSRTVFFSPFCQINPPALDPSVCQL